jgi:hypothetical protein
MIETLSEEDSMTGSYLDAVLEAVKFPARVADLDAGLPDVDGDALPHLPPLLSNNNRAQRLRKRPGLSRRPIGGGMVEDRSIIDRSRVEAPAFVKTPR